MQGSNANATYREGDKVFVDPEFTPQLLRDNKQPNCIIPAIVIQQFTRSTRVTIEDPADSKGKRINWRNTDSYGNTCFVLNQAIKSRI